MQSLLSSPPSESRTISLSNLATQFANQNNPTELKLLVEHLARTDSAEEAQTLARVGAAVLSSNSIHPAPYEAIIQAIQPRVAQHEELEQRLRDLYADLLVKNEDYSGAAKILSGLDLRSQRYSDAQRAERFVRIAELYLEDNDNVNAETFVNRASQVIHESNDPIVKSRYKVSYARTLDARRKYLEAAGKYYDLSTTSSIGNTVVAEADLSMLLSKAVVCAILSSAGPQRARMLGVLYKDERTRTVGGGMFFPILEKMHNLRLIRKSEVIQFQEMLEPHQKATFADGSTSLDRAVVEHNIVSAALLYENISLQELGVLLEVDAQTAERTVAKMIGEGRFQGSIDQVDSILYFARDGSKSTFNSSTSSSGSGSNGNKKSSNTSNAATTSDQDKGDDISRHGDDFDERISMFCDSVISLCDRVVTKYPQFATVMTNSR
jgi:COP9 signalosome complex subunit 4